MPVFYYVLVAVAMQVLLHLFTAPFYLQIFPLILLAWAFFEIKFHTRVIRLDIPFKIPKKMQKELNKLARKHIAETRQKLKNQPPKDSK